MAFTKITNADITGKGVVGLPDVPGLSTGAMQAKFDELALDVIIPAYNQLIDLLNGTGVADYSKITDPTDNVVKSLQMLANDLKTYIDTHDATKADKATTIAGYGITDAYTKSETDTALAGKADNATTLAGYGITNAYTKTEADNLLAGKADKGTSLSDYGIQDAYTKPQTDSALAAKADKATTLAGYGVTDAYTKTQVDNSLAGKVDKVAGKGLSTNDYDNTEKGNVASNTAARHTHTNKATLDAIDATTKGKYDALVTLLNGIVEIEAAVTNDATKIPTGSAIVAYVSGLGAGDMLKAVYDADDNGVVDNASALGGEAPSYYLDADNHVFDPTGTGLIATNTQDAVAEVQGNVDCTEAQIFDTPDEYDSTKSYVVGDYCVNLKKIYKCVTACSPAPWTTNSQYFNDTTLVDATNALSRPTFSEAGSRTNVASGDNVHTLWGKVKKFFSDLKTVAFTGSFSDLTGTSNVAVKNANNSFSENQKVDRRDGTVNDVGMSRFSLGNNIPSGTAGNSMGAIDLYDKGSHFARFYTVDNLSSTRYICLPDKNGTVALTDDIPDISTAVPIAQSKNQMLAFYAGTGSYRWLKVATLTITADYVDTPTMFEVSSRGWPGLSHISIVFAASAGLNPSLTSITTDNDNLWYIKHVDTSKWELYTDTRGVWNACFVHRITGCNVNNGISINLTGSRLSSAPTGTTQATYLQLSKNIVHTGTVTLEFNTTSTLKKEVNISSPSTAKMFVTLQGVNIASGASLSYLQANKYQNDSTCYFVIYQNGSNFTSGSNVTVNYLIIDE